MTIKRLISLLLAVLMIVSCLSFSTLSVSATEIEEKATIKVDTINATSGSQVTVNVSIENNPGILGMTLKVGYDEQLATLISVENGDALSNMTFTTPKNLSNGCKLPWDSEFVSEEHIKDGIIASLTFEVPETTTVGNRIPITLSYDPGAIIDNDMTPLTVDIEDGVINVINYIPGDLNEDNLINTTDVVFLRRYIAGGYGVKINEYAGDVNADGALNTTDVVFIRRYVAGGYNVELKPGMHTHTEVIDAAKDATCTETGLTEGKHCSACGEILIKQEVIPAKGHQYGDDQICDVCGEKAVEGKLIYAETFDRENSTDTVAILNALGWNQLTVERDGAAAESNARFEIRDGKLYYINYADDIAGKDSYYEIKSLSGDFMKDIFRETYSLQYDVNYSEASNMNRYVNIITEYTEGGKYYNTAHFRISGYGNNQCWYDGAWLNYEVEDENDLCAELKDDNNEFGYTSVCKKLLGQNIDTKVAAFKDITVSVRVVYDAVKGPEMYLKTAEMPEFIKVSQYSVNSEVGVENVWKTWEGTSTAFKIGAKINGWIDNIYLWQGAGDVPAVHEHNWSDWRVTSEADCLHQGVEQRTCSGCDVIDSRLIDALGHNFGSDNVCDNCAAKKYSEGLTYTLQNGDQGYMVSGIGSCTDTEIIIPERLPNGHIVSKIADGVFMNNTALTKISIPDTVESIGINAFAGCSNLAYNSDEYGIYLGNEENPYLVLVDVKDTLLTSFDFRPTTKIIGEKAFFSCGKLTSIAFPEGITQIQRYALQSCSSLKSVSIPASAKYLTFWMFYQTHNIQNITVAEGNPVYHSVGNCIVETATKTMIAGVESSVIPGGGEEITTIGNNAFCRADFTSLNIPFGITEISTYVFQNCPYLAYVIIPDTVSVIGSNAFKGCTNLLRIYYTGTAEEWANITIHNTNPELLAAPIVYYSENEPTGEGTYWHYVDGRPMVWATEPAVEDGFLIFEEKFDYENNNDTQSVLNTIGWTKLTKQENGVYNETDGEFAIVDGRLYYDNWDAEGVAEGDFRVRGADGYYQIGALNQEYMKPFVAGKYTLQYELEYVDSKNISRYAMLITECSADGGCYNSFMPRIGGYGNNQCHFYGVWRTYDKFDPATDLYAASTAIDAAQAASKGTPISFKLLGKYYNKEDIHMLADMKITVRLQWEPGVGHHVYMKVGEMEEFVKVSEPHADADGIKFVDKWEGYAVRFKFGGAIDGYIDNIAMWTGWGDRAEDGHFVSQWNIEKEATCSESGLAVGKCIKCGEKVNKEIATIAHDYTAWKQTTASTCISKGIETGTCACGATTTRDLATIDHIFTDDKCTMCGRGYNFDLKFSLSKDGKYYTVTGIGSCTDTEIYIPAQYNGIPVTTIGSDAFIRNTKITKVVIQDGVKTIENGAFNYCSSLTSLTLPQSLQNVGTSFIWGLPNELYTITSNGGKYLGTADNPYFLLVSVNDLKTVTSFAAHPNTKMIGQQAIQNCVYLESIVIPEGVFKVTNFAFNDCASLKTVTLPSTVTQMGYAFGECPLIEKITIHEDNPVYTCIDNCIIQKKTKTLIAGCVSSVIPTDGSVTSIGNCAFQYVPISTVVIPEGITSIGNSAFAFCMELKELRFPSTLTKIGSRAILDYGSLEKISVAEGNEVFTVVENCLINITNGSLVVATADTTVIPDCVKSIGSYAFYRHNISEIIIPDSVTSIERAAFYQCTNLTCVELPNSVTYLGQDAFSGCSNLREINIPESMTKIDLYAFYNCDSLSEIVLPDSVVTLGTYVFAECNGLTNVKLSTSVKNIPSYTFRNCDHLETVTIPASVTNIANYAFDNCKVLTTINYGGTAEQWAEVTIGSNNTYLTDATINYSAIVAE